MSNYGGVEFRESKLGRLKMASKSGDSIAYHLSKKKSGSATYSVGRGRQLRERGKKRRVAFTGACRAETCAHGLAVASAAGRNWGVSPSVLMVSPAKKKRKKNTSRPAQ